jgi:hypothetical protein
LSEELCQDVEHVARGGGVQRAEAADEALAIDGAHLVEDDVAAFSGECDGNAPWISVSCRRHGGNYHGLERVV